MTDPELLAKRLAQIETCVRELRELARPDAIGTDVREARFVEHTLQIAIQAALDTASHIVSDGRLGEAARIESCLTCWKRPAGSTPRWPRRCATWPAFATSWSMDTTPWTSGSYVTS